MAKLRLVFMGTPDFAVPALAAIVAAGHDIAYVYTQPPRPAGRGYAERAAPVQLFAESHGIPVRFPRTLRDPAVQAEFQAIGADAAVVAAYGLILPPAVLDAPRLGCINIHASLLPRWRGAAPIQRALFAGDRETGVTIMQMDAGLDTGPMLLRESIPIDDTTTAGELHDQLAALGAKLIVPALEGLAAGTLSPEPQPAAGMTYAPKLSRDDGYLDFRRPAAELARQTRALNPWPGTWFRHMGETIKVLSAAVAENPGGGAPGTVLDDRLTIACSEGALRLTRVQRAGRSPMDAAAFLRGYLLPIGSRLVGTADEA